MTFQAGVFVVHSFFSELYVALLQLCVSRRFVLLSYVVCLSKYSKYRIQGFDDSTHGDHYLSAELAGNYKQLKLH